jgi:hypothetical protein
MHEERSGTNIYDWEQVFVESVCVKCMERYSFSWGGGGVYRNLVVYRNLDVSVLAILIFMSWCVFS